MMVYEHKFFNCLSTFLRREDNVYTSWSVDFILLIAFQTLYVFCPILYFQNEDFI